MLVFKSSLKHWFLFQNFTFISSLNHTDLFLYRKSVLLLVRCDKLFKRDYILAFHIHCNINICLLSWIEKSMKVSQNEISSYYYRHLQSVYIVEQRKCCIGLNTDFCYLNFVYYWHTLSQFGRIGKQQGTQPYEGKK